MNANFSWLLGIMIFYCSCEKAEQSRQQVNREVEVSTATGRVIITQTEVKVAESNLVLPVGSTIRIAGDESEIQVELPHGYSFLTDAPQAKALPVLFSTYTCICSKAGNPCKVFYADGMGFGCLQYTCAGSCTGKFTYMGYTVDKVISTSSKEVFFADPVVQQYIVKELSSIPATAFKKSGKSDPVYLLKELSGVRYYLLLPDAKSLPVGLSYTALFSLHAQCDCEKTKACKLRTVTMDTGNGSSVEIHFCDGNCNGCELTVD